ncbi:MAG: hypothetical protein QG602_3795 [Verrucomicrobiota bacterium]|nr:hypothetical protein [Verrucomicrobiota bacterium]
MFVCGQRAYFPAHYSPAAEWANSAGHTPIAMSPRMQAAALTGGLLLSAALLSGADTVATTVYARIGNGYKRVPAKDGSYKPEYYALSNGGRLEGTTSDNTIDRVTYPEVAEIASKLLALQNFHYAQSKEQAKLLLVLNWGETLSFNGMNYNYAVQQLSRAAELLAKEKMYAKEAGGEGRDIAMGEPSTKVDAMTEYLLMLRMENKVRDDINLPNAKILGYLDAINDADGIQRWAGGGDNYNDLLSDIEEPRYYLVITAYDFPELLKNGTKRLLWQTRVSVRSPGNSFDQTFVPMLKSASSYFGRDSGKLVRSEQEKARVELGDLKFLGEARDKPEESPNNENK